MRRIVLITLILLTLATPSSAAPLRQYGGSGPTPGVISYQGRVQIGGKAFSGTGYFKFALVNQAGTHAFWSNDGTGLVTAPFTPTTPVTLSVSSGVFHIGLGDTSVSGMTAPITSTHVMTADRSLRVWFNDGSSHGWQQLTPDISLAAVPYILNADTIARGAGTLTVATTNDVSVPAHTHAVTSSSNPGAASAILASTAGGGLTLQTLTLPDVGWMGNSGATARLYFDSAAATDYAYFSGANVGIGTTAPTQKLEISGGQLLMSDALSGLYFLNVNNYIRRASDSSIRIGVAGSDRVTVLSGGSVGIGSTAPAAKLVSLP